MLRRHSLVALGLILGSYCVSGFSLETGRTGTHVQEVAVCRNRWCNEKGSGATLASFIGLAPDDKTSIYGSDCLGRCNRGPNVQVVTADNQHFEFSGIDGVNKVYDILVDTLGCEVSL